MYQETTEKKFIFFSFRQKKHEPYMFRNSELPKRKYEDTISTRLWRVYGKLIWRPFQRFIRKSSNSRPYQESVFKALLPERVEHPEFQYYSFIFMNTAYRWSNPIYVFMSYPVSGIKNYFWKNSHLVCNWDYSVSKTWRNPIKYKLLQRPFIHFAKFIEYTYRKDFTCCGYADSFCEFDDDRFELTGSGVSATEDGTDYWFRGYVHCPRCNTPVEHSDSSLQRLWK